MRNSLGKIFTVTSFGESHGRCVGVIIDGCPAGLAITGEEIQKEVDKRRPGVGVAATARTEEDRVEILSGVFDGRTTGAPICLLVWNKDVNSSGYEATRFLLRLGHADYTASVKYGGFNDFRGGGRFSGRITAAFVMAGAIAKKVLGLVGIEVLAHTVEIGGIKAEPEGFDEIKKNSKSEIPSTNKAMFHQVKRPLLIKKSPLAKAMARKIPCRNEAVTRRAIKSSLFSINTRVKSPARVRVPVMESIKLM